MSITIYHNPRCSKSRQTLQLIEEAGKEVTIVEYLKDPLDRHQLVQLVNELNIDVDALLRKKECKDHDVDPAELDLTGKIDAIAKYPKIMERPVVVTDKGAAICRPPERVLELI